jgi:uncharacterized protein YdbL (DUF1318 family)
MTPRLLRIQPLLVLASVLMVLLVVPAASAQTDLESLKKEFKERYPRLLELKTAGKVGETHEGYVATVRPRHESEVRSLLRQENEDRELLYELLREDVRKEVPEKDRDKVTAEFVARRNAERNLENARPDEWLMVADDVWIQKRDFARWKRLEKMKEDQKIGETWEGYVEALPDYANDGSVKSLVEEENKARRRRYEALAKEEEESAEALAREAAEARFKASERTHLLKTRDGEWVARKDWRG